MGWPTPQEYNEAIQNPAQNLTDSELQRGSVALDTIGLPRVASGNFASVYHIRCSGGRSFALRCFLHDISDQGRRYEEIAGFVMSDNLPSTVSFEYIKQGILVKGQWFPVLKMDWVDGEPLDEYVIKHARDKSRMNLLLESFKTMVLELQNNGIAHGDLQHGNILVLGNGAELRLVDYDGMFVPALAGAIANELGHRNYQHPKRSMYDFGANLDNFSAWSIYTSLYCIARDPEIALNGRTCDESLLFRSEDYRAPLKSQMFSRLEEHSDAEIRVAARKFRSLIGRALAEVPPLDEDFVVPEDLSPLAVVPIFAVDANLPDWLRGPNSGVNRQSGLHDNEPDSSNIDLPEKPLGPIVIKPATMDSCPTADEYLSALKEPRDALCRFPDLMEAVFPSISGAIKHIITQDSLVMPVFSGSTAYAIKVFLKPDEKRTLFYQTLEDLKLVETDLRKFLIPVEYYESGIRVKGKWYPLVRMPWLGGVTLRKIMQQSKSKNSLAEYAKQIRQLIEALDSNGLVHGNLNPSNLMIVGSQLKVLDYDTMRAVGEVPDFPLPHPDYCHPSMKSLTSEYSDHFSAWILDTTLICLSLSEQLREMQKPDGDLFCAADFSFADGKPGVFRRMDSDSDPLIKNRSMLLQSMMRGAPEDVPPLRMDVGITQRYAEQNSLQFHPISRTMVSPDARAPRIVTPAPIVEVGPAEMVEVVNSQLPVPAKRSAEHGEIAFFSLISFCLAIVVMLLMYLVRLSP